MASEPYWVWCPDPGTDHATYDLSPYGLDGTAEVTSVGKAVCIDGIPWTDTLDDEIAYIISRRFMEDAGTSAPESVCRAVRPIRLKDYGEYLNSLDRVCEQSMYTFANVSKLAERTDDLAYLSRIGDEMVRYSKEQLKEIEGEIPKERTDAYLRDLSFRESYLRSLRLML